MPADRKIAGGRSPQNYRFSADSGVTKIVLRGPNDFAACGFTGNARIDERHGNAWRTGCDGFGPGADQRREHRQRADPHYSGRGVAKYRLLSKKKNARGPESAVWSDERCVRLHYDKRGF